MINKTFPYLNIETTEPSEPPDIFATLAPSNALVNCPDVLDSMASVTYFPSVQDPGEIAPGVEVNVTCMEGYVFEYSGGTVFSQVATCTETGNWSTIFAACTEITCPAAPDYESTTQTFNNGALSNTSYGQTVGTSSNSTAM
ncbi:hypothetical protein ElyMa_001249700 [Elysia marginata]|uniref:Sushi domain-containing protein n=1 Tax=Elysia marginata TaxID=1093978 RepID=A0AAV4IBN4_9GAST|nr:hypothetical protein ElyMa_001249700 [Elysia marginata]